MRGEKRIEFDFEFEYSANGQFASSRELCLRAPGLGKFEVHATMQAFVAQTFGNLHSMRDSFSQEETETQPDNDQQKDLTQFIAMGLGVDEYPNFFRYVYRTLTNCPRLAYVDDGNNKQPVTDAVWESIEQRGGMEAINRVVSEFTDFFFTALASKDESGADKLTGSSEPTKVDSNTNTQKTSRTRKS